MGRELLEWNEWQPGLDTDEMTLGDVLASMPKSDANAVPEIVRRYENPESPEAFPGSITLARHDCLHVILGRGLHVQDEAFVIGATMGSASDITGEILDRFIEISTTLYPPVWRFKPEHIPTYRLGVGFSLDNLAGKDLHLTPFEAPENLAKSVKSLRDDLGLVKAEMRAYYRKEELLVPGTRATRRLDTSAKRTDQDL